MRRLRDFAAIRDFFGDREIDELQAAIDARRGARREAPAGRQDDPGAGAAAEEPPSAPEMDAHPPA